MKSQWISDTLLLYFKLQKLSDMIPAQPLADSERSQRSTSSFQQVMKHLL